MTYHLATEERIESDADRGAGDSSDFAFSSIAGESSALREVIEHARKIATRRRATVLILGETGTGKGLFARGLHYASAQASEPFVTVNCAAIPVALLESELFGHERGAFTDAKSRKRGLLELAGEGTLFLDEISELPPNLQPKLLRALEERRVRRLGGFDEIDIRCRIVAATNVSLEESVDMGSFREDLFYRLNVYRLALPPLRDRTEDIPLLAHHALEELSREQGWERKELGPGALRALLSHDWPGNVRELRNVIHRAAVMTDGNRIEAEHLMIHHRGNVAVMPSSPHGPLGTIVIPPGGTTLDAVEAEAIRLTLAHTGGNRTRSAMILGISRPTLLRKIRLYGLDPREGKQ